MRKAVVGDQRDWVARCIHDEGCSKATLIDKLVEGRILPPPAEEVIFTCNHGCQYDNGVVYGDGEALGDGAGRCCQDSGARMERGEGCNGGDEEYDKSDTHNNTLGDTDSSWEGSDATNESNDECDGVDIDDSPHEEYDKSDTHDESLGGDTDSSWEGSDATIESNDERDGVDIDDSPHDEYGKSDANDDACAIAEDNTVEKSSMFLCTDSSEDDNVEDCHEAVPRTPTDFKRHSLATSKRCLSARVVRGKRRQPCNDSCKSTSHTKSKRKKLVATSLGPPITPYRRPRRTVKRDVGEPLRRYRHDDGTWEITHSVKRVRVGLNCLFFGGKAIVRP